MKTHRIPILILVRHGQCDIAQIEDCLFGQIDIPLTELGYEQISKVSQEIIKLIHPINANSFSIRSFLSSDLKRCLQSATTIYEELMKERMKNVELKAKRELREYNLGDWENAKMEEVIFEIFNFIHCYKQNPIFAKPPGELGESHYRVATRLSPLIKELNKQLNDLDIIEFLHNSINCKTLNDLIWEMNNHKIHLDFNIWIVHEGSARLAFQLLNVETNFRHQNVENEFLNNISQNFFERGDFVCLMPVYHYGMQDVDGTLFNHHSNGRPKTGTTFPDEFNQHFECNIGWRIIHHHKSKDLDI